MCLRKYFEMLGPLVGKEAPRHQPGWMASWVVISWESWTNQVIQENPNGNPAENKVSHPSALNARKCSPAKGRGDRQERKENANPCSCVAGKCWTQEMPLSLPRPSSTRMPPFQTPKSPSLVSFFLLNGAEWWVLAQRLEVSRRGAEGEMLPAMAK